MNNVYLSTLCSYPLCMTCDGGYHCVACMCFIKSQALIGYVEVTATSLQTPLVMLGWLTSWLCWGDWLHPIENKQPVTACLTCHGYFSTSMMCPSIQWSLSNFAMYIVYYFILLQRIFLPPKIFGLARLDICGFLIVLLIVHGIIPIRLNFLWSSYRTQSHWICTEFQHENDWLIELINNPELITLNMTFVYL